MGYFSKTIHQFSTIMNKWEKISIIIFLLVIASLSAYKAIQNYYQETVVVAAFGGKYTEGIVADNKKDIDQIIQKLTKIGLTYFDDKSSLQPALAERWEISNDNKTYTFYLKNNIDSQKIAETIKSHKNGWSEIGLETPEKSIIKFILKEPYSPFLHNTAQPLFDFGPYELKKQDKAQIEFLARDNFIFGQPNIKEIIIKLYPDEGNLNKALRQKDIMGVGRVFEDVAGFNNFSMILPRYSTIFFNLNRTQFQKKNIRQKIKKEEKLDSETNAILVTNDSEENILKAEELKTKWESLNLKIEIRTYDSLELQKDIIPSRDYDILLYGIDYGYDPDPYPFWHTSQLISSGLNLSNFSNQKADTLLEEARQIIDENIRKQKYEEFQKILDEEVPAIIIEQTSVKYAISQDVKGIFEHTGIITADRFNKVWEWYIRTQRVRNK